MKLADVLKKIFVILVNGGLITYLVMLFLNGEMIVQRAYETSNLVWYIILIGIALYAFINYSIKQFHLSRARTTLSIAGLFMIVVGHYVLANNPEAGIFIGDIVKVVGVVFVIAGPAKLFVSKKSQEKAKEDKMEIIEV